MDGTIPALRHLIMKSRNVGLVCAAFLTVIATAHAIPTPINITVSGGADVVAAPKSDLGDFGDATVLSWLTTDVANYNGLNSTTLPAPVAITGLTGVTGGAGGNSITLNVTGFDYLFFHWGGQGGGWAQAFYVGGSTGNFTFDNSAIGTGQGPSVGGLSFYSFYDPSVPDGGSTVMMLGAALSGLGLAVRRFQK
jgi:hypothetical protein